MASLTNTPGLDKRRRHTLVVMLTFVTGCADATGFLALGGAFSSVMTGNMVLLGLSAGHTEAALAINSGSAIISYIVGVLLGAHIAGAAVSSDPVWPRQVTRALTAESVILLVFLLVWEVTLGHRSPDAALGLLMIAASALGIQSSAIQRFGVSGLSSTYLTGTLTTLIGAVAAQSATHLAPERAGPHRADRGSWRGGNRRRAPTLALAHSDDRSAHRGHRAVHEAARRRCPGAQETAASPSVEVTGTPSPQALSARCSARVQIALACSPCWLLRRRYRRTSRSTSHRPPPTRTIRPSSTAGWVSSPGSHATPRPATTNRYRVSVRSHWMAGCRARSVPQDSADR